MYNNINKCKIDNWYFSLLLFETIEVYTMEKYDICIDILYFLNQWRSSQQIIHEYYLEYKKNTVRGYNSVIWLLAIIAQNRLNLIYTIDFKIIYCEIMQLTVNMKYFIINAISK